MDVNNSIAVGGDADVRAETIDAFGTADMNLDYSAFNSREEVGVGASPAMSIR